MSLAEMGLGRVRVVTSSDSSHPPEFFADRVMARIMSVADTAPEPIRAQAEAFRNQVYGIVLDGIRRAMSSERSYQEGLRIRRG